MADIVEMILADHRRIRRLIAALQAAGRRADGPSTAWPLSPVWRRLAELVELHAEAEQEICYLEMFGPGPAHLVRWRLATADHADIHAAVAEVTLQPVGSPMWWQLVSATTRLVCDHMDAEERGVLASFARRATPQLRHELAQQWVSFVSARTRDAASHAGKPSGDTYRVAIMSSGESSGSSQGRELRRT